MSDQYRKLLRLMAEGWLLHAHGGRPSEATFLLRAPAGDEDDVPAGAARRAIAERRVALTPRAGPERVYQITAVGRAEAARLAAADAPP